MGIVKQLLFYLPIIGFIVWQIVALNRDPELKESRRDREQRTDDSASGESRHTERE